MHVDPGSWREGRQCTCHAIDLHISIWRCRSLQLNQLTSTVPAEVSRLSELNYLCVPLGLSRTIQSIVLRHLAAIPMI